MWNARDDITTSSDNTRKLLWLLLTNRTGELSEQLDRERARPVSVHLPARWSRHNIDLLLRGLLGSATTYRYKLRLPAFRRLALLFWLVKRLNGAHRANYVLLLRALVRANTDRRREALKDLEECAIDCKEIEFRKAYLLWAMDQFSEAHDAFRKLRERQPHDKELLQLEAHAAFCAWRFDEVEHTFGSCDAKSRPHIEYIRLAAHFAGAAAKIGSSEDLHVVARLLGPSDPKTIRDAIGLCHKGGHGVAARALTRLLSSENSLEDNARDLGFQILASEHGTAGTEKEMVSRIEDFVRKVGIPTASIGPYAGILVKYLDLVAARRISHDGTAISVRSILRYIDQCGLSPHILNLWRDMHFKEELHSPNSQWTGYMLLAQLRILSALRDITTIPPLRWMAGRMSEVVFERLIDVSFNDMRNPALRALVRAGLMLFAIRELYSYRAQKYPRLEQEALLGEAEAETYSKLKANLIAADTLATSHLHAHHNRTISDSIMRMSGSSEYLTSIVSQRCKVLERLIASRETCLERLSQFAMKQGVDFGSRDFASIEHYTPKKYYPNRPACTLVSSENTIQLNFFDGIRPLQHRVFVGADVRALCRALDAFREGLARSRTETDDAAESLVRTWAQFMADGAPLMWQTFGRVIVELCAQAGISELAVFSLYKGAIIPIHLAKNSEGKHQRYLIEHVSISYAPSLELNSGDRTSDGKQFFSNDLAILLSDGLRKDFKQTEEIELLALYNSHGKRGNIFSPRTPRDVLDALRRSRIVHVSCHGDWRPDPIDVRLMLSRGGHLTVGDILCGAPIRAELVILASCDVGSVPAIAPSGQIWMPFALLERGARGVIAPFSSVWNNSTCALMSRLHANLTDNEVLGAQALAAAQRNCICSGPRPPVVEHGFRGFRFFATRPREIRLDDPMVWGPFVHFSNF